MKLYLDTNIIWAWFERNAKNVKKNKPLQITSLMKYLSTREFDLFVSRLTKAEIFRFLKSQHSASRVLCEKIWNDFKEIFDISELKISTFEVNLDDLVKVCTKTILGKKTLINLVHIQIAKDNKLIFLSGDKSIVERVKWYYSNVIDYPTLRKQVL